MFLYLNIGINNSPEGTCRRQRHPHSSTCLKKCLVNWNHKGQSHLILIWKGEHSARNQQTHRRAWFVAALGELGQAPREEPPQPHQPNLQTSLLLKDKRSWLQRQSLGIRGCRKWARLSPRRAPWSTTRSAGSPSWLPGPWCLRWTILEAEPVGSNNQYVLYAQKLYV